jgi:hypothetical protein
VKEKIQSTLHAWSQVRGLPEIIALLGGAAYLVQSWVYAHTQSSVMDEGLYQVKGWLFVRGLYEPFQDFGPLTNHMPLAFYIPGVVQNIFGPGIRAGRYLSIVLGVVMLVGVWILVRRFASRWWAAAAIWMIAVNPMLLKMYSVGVSQVIIACMLVWVLVLSLGRDRTAWQLIAASVLAAAMWMTRINLAPVLLLLIVYIAWEYGWKRALNCGIAGFLAVALVHALFWPGILRLWAAWLPSSITPFLDAWREVGGGGLFWTPEFDALSRVRSLIQGMQFHFMGIGGAMAAWLLWRPRRDWSSDPKFKAAVFLSALLVSLFLLHAWASVGLDYCVYCLRRYLGFFSLLGILLLVLVLSEGIGAQGRVRRGMTYAILTGVVILLVFEVGLVFDPLNYILETPVPRVQNMAIQPGFTTLGIVLLNKFGLARGDFAHYFQNLGVHRIPWWVYAALVLAAIFLAAYLVMRSRQARSRTPYLSHAVLSLLVLLGAGFILSPTQLLGAGYDSYDCQMDVIESYERAGEELSDRIQPGAQIFWKGGNSPLPLLYLPEAKIYPAQLNGDYTFRIGGDPPEIARRSLWNQALAEEWWRESDIILIEERFYDEWRTESPALKEGEAFYSGLLDEIVGSDQYNEHEPTSPVLPCSSDSFIRIFERMP